MVSSRGRLTERDPMKKTRSKRDATARNKRPAAPKAEAAPRKASEIVDGRMAAIAIAKSRAGESPTAAERAALGRFQRAEEERQRWEYYRTIPQVHYSQMSGRQPKILAEQQERYGIPFG